MKVSFSIMLIILFLMIQPVWAAQNYTVIIENLSEKPPPYIPPPYPEPPPTKYITITTETDFSVCFDKIYPAAGWQLNIYRRPQPLAYFNIIDNDDFFSECSNATKRISWEVYFHLKRKNGEFIQGVCPIAFESTAEKDTSFGVTYKWFWEVTNGCRLVNILEEAKCGGIDCLGKRVPANRDFPTIQLVIKQNPYYRVNLEK
ncbi:hypothetical protein ID852_03500 [Xenorhabdus sp. 42]|uniref:hypothetical protein n=1 Tax=Xenorhabdus szentirmaii TaxID=290112 RepID=UPI0019B20164|nr:MULTISPECIES: hypothetical protein [unclassified Xenorhabdus]MBD2780837.1 hypothetical protein [Xenorhabdus sp. 38]MBD2819772.1 hypothetical protein [Xenorhabdus sp. 42]